MWNFPCDFVEFSLLNSIFSIFMFPKRSAAFCLAINANSPISLCRLASTIYALSSGPPPSAIAVLRISGEASKSALQQLTRRKKPFEPHRLFYTPIFDLDGRLLDRTLACFMKGPKTFTGEDSAELYLHGSRAVVQAVCATLAKMPDLEAARAGEFTRRAFHNGKMNALQVEALGDLLQAETDAQLQLSHAQARIGDYLLPTREKLVRLLARMEARIDFAEDLGDIDQTLEEEFRDDIQSIAQDLRRFLRGAKRGQLIKTGLNVALVGRPNVGKSSLMNRLAERELAIVSNISGTTRDCLETRLHLDGQLVNVVDTAGIRKDTEDPLEREGIRRTLERAASANLVLLVLDGSEMGGNDGGKEEVGELLAQFNHRRGEQRVIVCLNKEDLVEEADKEGIRRRMELALKPSGHCQLVWTCCLRENGLNELLKAISTHLQSGEEPQEGNEIFLSRERHIQCLQKALEHLEATKSALSEWDDPAMAAFSLQQCADAVGEIAGTIVHEQILDSIFTQFCIGK